MLKPTITLPVPETTSLAHALRWICTGTRVLDLVEQNAIGDFFFGIVGQSYTKAKQELLLSLRHGSISSRGRLNITYHPSREDQFTDDILGRERRFCPYWEQVFSTQIDEVRNSDGGRVPLQSIVDVEKHLWQDYYVDWHKNQLIYGTDIYRLTVSDIELRTSDLFAAFSDCSQAGDGNVRQSPTLHTKEVESLQKLAIGMAVEQYDYDPKALRGNAVPNIASDLATSGVPLDQDTIRKHLRRAADAHLPDAPERAKPNSSKA